MLLLRVVVFPDFRISLWIILCFILGLLYIFLYKILFNFLFCSTLLVHSTRLPAFSKMFPVIRLLVGALSPRRSGFNPRRFNVRVVMNSMALRHLFLRVYEVFPCQEHSTNTPYSFIHVSLTLYNINSWQRRQIAR
jgi:hypothetical protein